MKEEEQSELSTRLLSLLLFTATELSQMKQLPPDCPCHNDAPEASRCYVCLKLIVSWSRSL